MLAGLARRSRSPRRSCTWRCPTTRTAAPDSPQRQAYDLISEYFGPGLNGPLVVLVEDLDPATASSPPARSPRRSAARRSTRRRFDGGLDDVDARRTVCPDGTTGAPHRHPGQRPAGRGDQRRSSPTSATWAPACEPQTGADLAVTGQTAVGIDVSDRLGDALLPLPALVVVGLALLLLMLVFRSILVPLKAALGFLLSVAASFGAVVAVFQWGWLGDLFGVDTTGPVVSFLPIILIGVLFGLAMDYQVFLVSRMREEYVHGDAAARRSSPASATAPGW